jgi:hypothetical protein
VGGEEQIMVNVPVAVRGKLRKAGSPEIDLLVHSYYIGQMSPCVVVKDCANRGLIGGHVHSLHEIFELEAAKHPGYHVRERMTFVASTVESPQPAAIQRDTHRDTQ